MPLGSESVRGGNFLERLVRVEHGEWPRLAIAFFYFFFLLFPADLIQIMAQYTVLSQG